MRALPKPPRSEGIAQLVVLKGFFFPPLSSKASGSATVREGEWSKRTLGMIQPGNFHLSERYSVSARVSGKGLCCYI